MFDRNKILTGVKSYLLANGLDGKFDDIFIELNIDNAISYGSNARNCTVTELEKEVKDYTAPLYSMTLSGILLADKLGRLTYTENGVSTMFEDGSCYQKKDTIHFVPKIKAV